MTRGPRGTTAAGPTSVVMQESSAYQASERRVIALRERYQETAAELQALKTALRVTVTEEGIEIDPERVADLVRAADALARERAEHADALARERGRIAGMRAAALEFAAASGAFPEAVAKLTAQLDKIASDP